MKESTGKPILDALINASESFATPTPERAAQPQSRGEQVLNIILPNVQQGLTGVWRILRAHDLVTLEYVDGEKESAIIPLAKWMQIHDKPFSIVGEVQYQARKPQ